MTCDRCANEAIPGEQQCMDCSLINLSERARLAVSRSTGLFDRVPRSARAGDLGREAGKAGKAGKAISSSEFPVGSPEWEKWQEGFIEGRAEREDDR